MRVDVTHVSVCALPVQRRIRCLLLPVLLQVAAVVYLAQPLSRFGGFVK